jgi:hypothetical protein
MAKRKSNYILDYLTDKKKVDIARVEKALKDYPYFQPLHALLAKFTQHENFLHQAALYSNNRAWLKQIIENKVDTNKRRHAGKKKAKSANLKTIDQLETMESFISSINESFIKGEEMNDEKKDLALASTTLNDDLITEFYANSMLKKGKKKMALIIYEKLILKIPEKKAYFEDIIENIKT